MLLLIWKKINLKQLYEEEFIKKIYSFLFEIKQ